MWCVWLDIYSFHSYQRPSLVPLRTCIYLCQCGVRYSNDEVDYAGQLLHPVYSKCKLDHSVTWIDKSMYVRRRDETWNKKKGVCVAEHEMNEYLYWHNWRRDFDRCDYVLFIWYMHSNCNTNDWFSKILPRFYVLNFYSYKTRFMVDTKSKHFSCKCYPHAIAYKHIKSDCSMLMYFCMRQFPHR